MDSSSSGDGSGRKYVDVSTMFPAALPGSSSARRGDSDPVPGEEGTTTGAGSSSSDGGSFDCNICLELAQDPVVTVCGHLFCWPCLYRWLHLHSILQECPVCKAGVEEEKVIPLYGRGKVGAVDPRTKAVPGVNIPQRPPGQRPETVRPSEHDFHAHGFNFMTGSAIPTANARFGNITLSAGFGLFPSLFGLQLHGFQGTGFSGAHGIHLGAAAGLAGHVHAAPQAPEQPQDAFLSRIFLLLGVFVILCLLFF